jgi:hypothetical protein
MGRPGDGKGGGAQHSPHPPFFYPYPAVMPFRIPFAGEGEFFTPDSVLSHCYGALLPMFTTKKATTLRQLCRELQDYRGRLPLGG